ncbi:MULTISPECIES: winged helix-turn-helix domain-containing protein [Roseobacteraceae]|uniref:Winged helix DNA-binding domain protein n=1 Tax=Pseudosulfitobacter pseudonitzschiae TaxID=1402135 RepID=A0A221K559_9RHOB|nr:MULTISPECIES: crosslink repair DNA glycosylase YcaQ family protein [Roseobacteraceae]ASM74122.1 winged helix DNA-binding domain protein [Pseudosulfitobacter pseudonitzschiae]
MTRPVLNNTAARRVFLDRHALHETPQGPAHGDALASLITRLGFVQLDSINTVARAHDLILFARRPRYRPKALDTLYQRDRALFEHWTHDAAVIPMEFYPQWHMRRTRDAERLKKAWSKDRRAGFEAQYQTVLDHIRENGACSSSDVGTGEKKGSGGWWDWHPSKTALEYLWRSGALAVTGRSGFQKRYDLTERVIDKALANPAHAPDTEQTIDWCCTQALDRLGFANHSELAAFWGHIRPAEAQIWVKHALARGSIIAIDVENADGSLRGAFARPDLPYDPAIQTPPSPRLRILSPFDPALRDRKRAEQLFGFHYRIEVFVPEPKRTYGYYVFPILEGDRLVGRIDMKAFRAEDTLKIRALWPERGVRWGKGRTTALNTELSRMLNLAGVGQITFAPNWLRTQL